MFHHLKAGESTVERSVLLFFFQNHHEPLDSPADLEGTVRVLEISVCV